MGPDRDTARASRDTAGGAPETSRDPEASGDRDVLSFCRICVAACGIKITLDGERVVRVRGDADHPISRGYTCSKGRGLADWHHAPSRLDHPRLLGADVGWDDLLGDLAGRLSAIRDGAGPDAIGAYLATGIAYDAGGQMAAGSFLRALGSTSAYSAVTVDNAPVVVAAELVAGNAALRPIWDPDAAGLLILVGTNPVVSHGYGTALPDPVTHLRRYRADGGRIWVVDPRRTESAGLADEHLAVRPGADVPILAAVVAALLDDGADTDEIATYCRPDEIEALRTALAPFSVTRAAEAADVPVDAVARLIADVRANRGRIALLVGTGSMMSTDGVVVEWLRWLVLILTGSLDRPGGMPFHHSVTGRLRPRRPKPPSKAPAPGPASRPDLPRVARELPAVALVDEIEAGTLKALVVIGGNPVTAMPDPERMRRALGSLEVLAVVDVLRGEMTELATHVLPATGQLERADVTMSSFAVRSTAQATRPVVAPVADRRPMWWSLGSLAHRMGLDLLGDADPDALTDEVYIRRALGRSDTVDADELFAAGPHGVEIPVEHGWVHEALPDGRWNLTPDGMLARLAAYEAPTDGLVLTPRREMGWNNSVHYGGPEALPLARMHPDDVDGAGLETGGAATIRSAHGSLRASIAPDEHVRRGVVSINHGRSERSPGSLTSGVEDVDPLTAMPKASGVPVTVEPDAR